MGREKLTLLVEREPILTRLLRAVSQAGCAPILLVVPVFHDHLLPAATASGAEPVIVPNPDATQGRATSIRAGLLALDADVGEVMITPADLPFLNPVTIRRLIAHYRRRPALTYPQVNGRKGHPVIIPRSHFPLLESLSRDETLAPFIAANPDACRPMACNDEGCLIDIDTPEAALRNGIDPAGTSSIDSGGAYESC